ncbi:cupin domain-containing protein, partial [Glutamicibacter soli]
MILRKGSVAGQQVAGSAPRVEERFGDAAGTRILGINIVTLEPGQMSAKRHWHSGSDEFVMVLDGVATVIDDD